MIIKNNSTTRLLVYVFSSCCSSTRFIIPRVGAISFPKQVGTTILRRFFQYKPDTIWKYEEQGGTWGKGNRPTAGARTQQPLPRGDHPLQLYSIGTPNGMKVTCLLEELNLQYGLEYDAWPTVIGGDYDSYGQFTTGFVQANPNSKIPALLHYDSSSTSTSPIRVFESASIMMYLCEQFDNDSIFLPPSSSSRSDQRKRAECLSWLFWTQGSAPFLGGGFGHFYSYAPTKIKYAIDRYTMEAKRQLDVLERHLSGTVVDGETKSVYAGGPYLCGDHYTIADICCFPWYGLLVLEKLYSGSGTYLQVQEYPHVMAWAKRISERQGIKRGCVVNPFGGSADDDQDNKNGLWERHDSKDFDNIELP